MGLIHCSPLQMSFFLPSATLRGIARSMPCSAWSCNQPEAAQVVMTRMNTVSKTVLPRVGFRLNSFRRDAHRAHVLFRCLNDSPAFVAYQQVLVESRRISCVERIHAVGYRNFIWIGGAASGIQTHGSYA
jgi:hypothetical protein